jgi:predicted nucleic acid-binding protein
VIVVRKELLVADTSYFGARDRGVARIWPLDVVGRLRAADLGLSVVTVAEMEFGRRNNGWSRRRWIEADLALDEHPRLAFGERTAKTAARIKHAELSSGRTFSQNDLWIAATAQTLGVPLVTCDRAFLRMESLDVEVVHLPARVPAEVGGTR